MLLEILWGYGLYRLGKYMYRRYYATVDHEPSH
jgi:hypothetical protein